MNVLQSLFTLPHEEFYQGIKNGEHTNKLPSCSTMGGEMKDKCVHLRLDLVEFDVKSAEEVIRFGEGRETRDEADCKSHYNRFPVLVWTVLLFPCLSLIAPSTLLPPSETHTLILM